VEVPSNIIRIRGDDSPSISSGLNEKELIQLRRELILDGLFFAKYFLFHQEQQIFYLNPHHRIINHVLDMVLAQQISRLIINVPPGYSKTMLVVIMFISRCLALYPGARFIHASYSQDLAYTNSVAIRNIINTEEYQRLWPMEFRIDERGKKRWFNKDGGGLMATAAGGQITGFRAGRITDIFSGAFIIDDPIKPADAYSDKKRSFVNEQFNNTIRSRLAIESVPIIIIMQRVHEDDLCGFLLRGGSDEQWHHLNLPALIDKDYKYPKKDYKFGIEIPHTLKPGALWELKHTKEQLKHIEVSDPYTFSAQYNQSPAPMGGGIFKDHFFKYFGILPKDVMLKRIYADTASKTKTHNDWSVFQCWAYSPSRGIFLIDQIRGKWEADELELRAVAFWRKHCYVHKTNPIGVSVMKIEDKSSGTFLIQNLARKYNIPVEGIQRNIDKVTRAMGVVPQMASGNVYLDSSAPWLNDYLDEFMKFTPLMTHRHDDQIDPTMDAIEDLLMSDNMTYLGAI
jgi:predicted phage terminase large subunit-like protein